LIFAYFLICFQFCQQFADLFSHILKICVLVFFLHIFTRFDSFFYILFLDFTVFFTGRWFGDGLVMVW